MILTVKPAVTLYLADNFSFNRVKLLLFQSMEEVE